LRVSNYGTGLGGEFVAIHAPAAVAETVAPSIAMAPLKVDVPATKEALLADGEEYGQWAVSSKWAQAAFVWAWVTPGTGQGTSGGIPPEVAGTMSMTAFAKLGIKGLKDKTEVSTYHAMWQWAIDHGYAKPSVKGKICALPSIEWDDAKAKLAAEKAAEKAETEKPEPGKFDALAKAIQGLDSADVIEAIKLMAKAVGVAVSFSEVDIDAAVNYSAQDKTSGGGLVKIKGKNGTIEVSEDELAANSAKIKAGLK
jgi:hypothetical protein